MGEHTAEAVHDETRGHGAQLVLDVSRPEALGGCMRQRAYVTDGSWLIRLVAPFDRPVKGGVVGLEDCRSLDVVLVPTEEFRRWALRAV